MTACPNCGTQVTGRYCSECGSSLAALACPKCSTTNAPGTRFCANCGARLGMPRAQSWAWPWAIVGVVVIAMVAMAIAFGGSPVPPPAQQPTAGSDQPGEVPAVALENLTPRQQADQFFDHIMRADARGDSAQMMVFRPLALEAYAQLDSLDNDARFHLGLIHAMTGGSEAALAQADTLELSVPGHLLASNIRHAVAEKSGDTAAARRAYQAFLESYEREIITTRAEYTAHRTLLEGFKAQAESALAIPGDG